MFRALTQVLLLLFGLTAFVGVANADSTRVVLVDADRAFEQAVRTSLSAWPTTVVAVRVKGPGSTMPGSAERARALANQERAEAVVWISRSEDGFALWMYDSSEDTVVVRRLASPPPYDEPTAASVALIVKTMLRHSTVPPASERAQMPIEVDWLRVGLLSGVRYAASSPEGIEPRLGVTASAWPLAGHRAALGFGLRAISGTGLRVENALFDGRWTDTDVSLTAQGRLSITSAFNIGLVLGAGLSFTTINGLILRPRESTERFRLNPIVTAHSDFGLRLTPSVRAGLRLGVSRTLSTQSYVVRGSPVWKVNPTGFEALLGVEFGLR